jgi:predicted protein tyrosine phosphatase
LADHGAISGMHPVLKIYDQTSFEGCGLNGKFQFAISIQNKGSYPAVLRPDFRGRRLNLYFDDVVEGPGAATPADIEALFSFGIEWLADVRKHHSSTVVHCGAGISRSAAAALLFLVLYFENYLAAATHLFRLAPHVAPNALICRLIFEKLGPVYGPDIFAALAEGKQEASRSGTNFTKFV